MIDAHPVERLKFARQQDDPIDFEDIFEENLQRIRKDAQSRITVNKNDS